MTVDETKRMFILRAEIAALLHDVGKTSLAFGERGFSGGDVTGSHTRDFFQGESNLLDLLNTYAAPELQIPHLKKLGDLARFHHINSRKDETEAAEYFGIKSSVFPSLIYLMMSADTVDSSTSKGGAVFNEKNGRLCVCEHQLLRQNPAEGFLATPFGEVDIRLPLGTDADRAAWADHAESALKSLAEALRGYDIAKNISEISAVRSSLSLVMKERLSCFMADTRLPTNDVSLWQHCFSTASIFKAMLAACVYRNDFSEVHENGNLVQGKQKLALLGLRWDEDAFLQDCTSPKDMLARRGALEDAANQLRVYLETGLCLGNEIFRDRHGIYCLVPEPRLTDNEDPVRAAIVGEFCAKVENVFNGGLLGGDVHWRIVCRSFSGMGILHLASLLQPGGDDGDVLCSGPREPAWMAQWNNASGSQRQICPVCGFRPWANTDSVTGSVHTAAKAGRCCEVCKDRRANGQELRKGIEASTKGQYFRIDQLLEPLDNDDEAGNRVVLIQTILDFRSFLSGQAFSSILGANPTLFGKGKGDKDMHLPLNSWNEMIKSAQSAWDTLKSKDDVQSLHTFQQLFRDTFLGNPGDGRIPGNTMWEKARNILQCYLDLKPSFFAGIQDNDAAVLVNHALRQHPAPSRMTRMLDQGHAFREDIFKKCLRSSDKEGTSFFPLGYDYGWMQMLVPARDARKMLGQITKLYTERFGRVRHLLPLHLSATVFYHKSPLYIALDAARRFAKQGFRLSRKPVRWHLKSMVNEDSVFRLVWLDAQKREVVWAIPQCVSGSPRDDEFHTWFWEHKKPHPTHVKDLTPGWDYYVHPSSFDYEVLDATTRRYDIRPVAPEAANEGEWPFRPHMARNGQSGPRPFPLGVLDEWNALDKSLGGAMSIDGRAQHKTLVEKLTWLHQTWASKAYSSDYRDELRDAASDILTVTLGRKVMDAHKDLLVSAASDASLIDLFEWRELIDRS